MKKDYSYLSQALNRRELINRISAEGFVLLKNEGNVLPYRESDKVAVFGRTQVDTIKGGTGSASITTEQNITLIATLENSDINIYSPLAEKYKKWSGENPIPNYGVWGSGMHSTPEMPIEDGDIKAAFDSGVNKAIIVIGRSAGENEDTLLTKGDFYLSDEEEELFEAVTSVFSDVTVILNTTGIIDFSFIDKFNIKSVLYVNMLANSSIPAVADVLSGKVNPSGKLTSTVAFDYFDYPSSQHFGQNKGGTLQDYFEDIYVGYRYETFEGADKKVRFPFGFGLSYTTFKIDNFCFKDEGESISVSAKVTNTGKIAGKETVQLYFKAPVVCKGAKLYKPMMNLCAFEKTGLLSPNESQNISFTVLKDKLASFDDTGVTGHRDCWVLEAGEYFLYIGNSVKNAKENCAGSFNIDKLKVVEKCHSIPTALPQRLLGNGETERLETVPVDVLEGVRVGIEPQDIDALLFACCDGNISALKKGESAEYRLIFCASGGYNLKIFVDKALSEKSAEDIIEIYSDKNQIDLSKISVSEDGAIELPNLIFPIGKVVLTIKAVCDLISIKGLNTQKITHLAKVLKDGITTIEAERFYECAFMVGAKSFCDKKQKRGGYLYNMNVPGKFATYKLDTEVAGVYELRFKYSNPRKAVNLNGVMAVFVSNVGQSVEDIPLSVTCQKDEFDFVLSDPIKITLPHGESYLKFASAGWDFPDIDYITLERSSQSGSTTKGSSLVVREIDQSEFGAESFEIITEKDCEKRGIQLSEVYKDGSLMPAFLDQLSNEELALLISGNFSNRTATGTTGTTSPLFDRCVYPVQTADGPTGLRLRTQTLSFPSGTLLASSWNTALAEEMGAAMAYEAKRHEVDCILGPGLNIHRDIRCGRNFEYYSEDPLLSGKFAAAVVIGMQNEGISAMAKHYAANNCEYERLKSNSRVSARALREIYLKGFEIVIKEANPHAIMTSYNHINNTKICEKHELITLVPRDEWGYDGIFVTDWLNDSDHVKETAAGHDLKMSQGNPEAICKAMHDGVLSREKVQISAERVLRFVMKSDYFNKKIKE